MSPTQMKSVDLLEFSPTAAKQQPPEEMARLTADHLEWETTAAAVEVQTGQCTPGWPDRKPSCS
eukprot:CAMPEP_0181519500 /NCGR_PEP_ID=MMETSP1110-20121109/65817_1 /TAXON_ID=174948 /ORGANISM="Symbiodinium sp., Strain CCMP421" /LENGTH=63 /DNA_ID=CAMNT_0023649941 /DNA_START=312 /DNA_END=501 /DNA_ORIENTATION=-